MNPGSSEPASNMPRFVCFLLLAAISPALLAAEKAADANAAFDRWTGQFLREYYDARPVRGVELGGHQYDGKFAVPDRASLDAEIKRLKRSATELTAMPERSLSAERRKDRALILANIAGDL